MAEKKHKHIINLLPNKNDNILNDFLSWALTIGRLLVILTETLALSVFLYRFTLDMQIVDLHDKIKTDSAIVSNFKSGEDTFRNFQKRLAAANAYDQERDKELTILKDIIEMGRGKVTFKNLVIRDKTISIVIEGSSANTLSEFTQNLKGYQGITRVSVDLVENKTSNALVTIAITAKYQ